MALTVDTTNFGYNGSAATTSTTVSLTIGASATLLVVMTVAQSANNSIVSGVTWNGTAMTQRIEHSLANSVTIWTLDAPATGTHDIVMSTASGCRQGLAGISFNGAYALGSTGSNDGAGTSASITCTTSGTGNGFVVSNIIWNDPASFSYTGSGTSIETATQAGQLGRSYVYEAYASGANPVESWTQTNPSRDYDIAYLEIQEASSAKGQFFRIF